MGRIYKSALCFIVLGLFGISGIVSIIIKDREYSENENRYLVEIPKMNISEILAGNFQIGIDNYISDQFVCRDELMKLYAATELAFGKNDYNGVYNCKDNWLIEVYNEPRNTEAITERFKKIVDKTESDCYIMLIPTAVSIYEDYLPAGVTAHNKQRETMNYIYANCGMRSINVWETLEKKSKIEQMYYKTDHHWTTFGAYEAYKKYCEELSFDFISEDYFDITKVSDSFYGTVYSKALKPGTTPDSIYAFKQSMDGITISYSAGEGELYNEDYLNKKDKYSYFLNGIQPMITIINENIKNDSSLLVVKDSYANCFVPFLINHYNKIVVLDTRYYRDGVTDTAIKENINEILFLFNLNTLDNETALAGVY